RHRTWSTWPAEFRPGPDSRTASTGWATPPSRRTFADLDVLELNEAFAAQAELRRVLGNRRLPDGRLGFFHPDALTFGDPVRVSRLVAAAAAVPGVLSAKVTRLRRLFRTDQGELAAGVLPVGALEVAVCDNDPARPENGRLSIEIGGGR
ncbi:hypothetical protein ACWDZ8_36605, partial [Streptomyces sp. NPDC003233]